MKTPEPSWIPYLISVLLTDIAALIVREPEEAQDYKSVKEMLLRRFKFTGDKLRQLFVQHKKDPEKTWQDIFDISGYFEGWLEELDVRDFEKLKQLIIADHLKKKVPPEIKEHFIDIWSEFISSVDLVEKLDAYENVRSGFKKPGLSFNQRRPYPPKPPQERKPHYEKKEKVKSEEKPEVLYYGCGTPGVTLG